MDAALRSIADNLAALRLDLVLHLKTAVAIVAPLMGGAGEPVPAPPPRATHGFSRRPLPRAYRPFIGPTMKVGKGSSHKTRNSNWSTTAARVTLHIVNALRDEGPMSFLIAANVLIALIDRSYVGRTGLIGVFGDSPSSVTRPQHTRPGPLIGAPIFI